MDGRIKKIIIFVVVFFLVVWVYSSIKSFFQHYFTGIEKRQTEMLMEFKKIKSGNIAVSEEAPSFAMLQEIGKMKEEIAKLKDEMSQKDDVLGLLDRVSTSTPSPTGKDFSTLHFVTISNSKWPTVDVFAEKNNSSRIVGQAIYNKSYPYTKKESGYYYIALSDTVYGWIHSQFVREY